MVEAAGVEPKDSESATSTESQQKFAKPKQNSALSVTPSSAQDPAKSKTDTFSNTNDTHSDFQRLYRTINLPDDLAVIDDSVLGTVCISTY